MKNVLVALTAIFISNLVFGQKQKDFQLDKIYPLGADGTIYLKAHDAKVTITGELRSDVAIKINYKIISKGVEWGTREFSVEVESRGSDLHIEEFIKGSITSIGYSSTEYTIDIKAPISSNWDINGDDDDYQISSINGEISINADDADVVLKNCQGDRFFFDLDDGMLFMEQGKGDLTVRIDDGDIEIRNATFTNIDYRGDDGHVAIETTIDPNAIFMFNGDDTTYDLAVTQGGGTFSINHDNGKIVYDSHFRLMEKEEDRTILSLTGGRSKIIISGDDIRVNLSAFKAK